MRTQWKVAAAVALALVIAFGWMFKSGIKNRVENLLGLNRVHWVNKLPHKLKRQGVLHHVIKSEVLGHPVGVSVYRPVTFANSHANSQPKSVLYYFHGRGGSEVTDVEGVLGTILPILAELQLPEPLVVFPNGGDMHYRAPFDRVFFDELIPQIEAMYIADGQERQTVKRLLMGFSFGGFGALSFTLHEPAQFAGMFSFAGGMNLGDPRVVARVEEALPTLRQNNFAAYFVNGEWDRPEIFAPLAEFWSSAGVNAHRVVLPETPHALHLYLQRSTSPLRDFFASTLKPHPEG